MAQNANSTGVFQRVEKKYLMEQSVYQALLRRIEPQLVSGMYGRYTICNIYFDTPTDELVRRSIEKPKYKEKLRLRSYGVPSLEDTVFLEIKKKWNATVYKRRIALSYAEARAYLLQGQRPAQDSQILHELDYFLQFYRPLPRLYLAYDRQAFSDRQDPQLRITFDENIRSRTNELQLDAGDAGRLLLLPGQRLMEIKVPAALPLWLATALSELEIYPISFSKYGTVYLNNLREIRRQTPCLQAY